MDIRPHPICAQCKQFILAGGACGCSTAVPSYDEVEFPEHYNGGGIDVFAFIDANFTHEQRRGGYAKDVIKYVIRAGKKPGVPALQDYRKAQQYLNKLIELEETS